MKKVNRNNAYAQLNHSTDALVWSKKFYAMNFNAIVCVYVCARSLFTE